MPISHMEVVLSIILQIRWLPWRVIVPSVSLCKRVQTIRTPSRSLVQLYSQGKVVCGVELLGTTTQKWSGFHPIFIHLRLNMDRKLIANKYLKGKMKSTLQRELKEPEIDGRIAFVIGQGCLILAIHFHP